MFLTLLGGVLWAGDSAGGGSPASPVSLNVSAHSSKVCRTRAGKEAVVRAAGAMLFFTSCVLNRADSHRRQSFDSCTLRITHWSGGRVLTPLWEAALQATALASTKIMGGEVIQRTSVKAALIWVGFALGFLFGFFCIAIAAKT